MILGLATAISYSYVIKYKRGGWYNCLLPLVAVVATVDVIANYTEWYWIFGKPPKGCTTISKRLDWMVVNAPHQSQREFARLLNVFLDACEDDGKH